MIDLLIGTVMLALIPLALSLAGKLISSVLACRTVGFDDGSSSRLDHSWHDALSGGAGGRRF